MSDEPSQSYTVAANACGLAVWLVLALCVGVPLLLVVAAWPPLIFAFVIVAIIVVAMSSGPKHKITTISGRAGDVTRTEPSGETKIS